MLTDLVDLDKTLQLPLSCPATDVAEHLYQVFERVRIRPRRSNWRNFQQGPLVRLVVCLGRMRLDIVMAAVGSQWEATLNIYQGWEDPNLVPRASTQRKARNISPMFAALQAALHAMEVATGSTSSPEYLQLEALNQDLRLIRSTPVRPRARGMAFA